MQWRAWWAYTALKRLDDLDDRKGSRAILPSEYHQGF